MTIYKRISKAQLRLKSLLFDGIVTDGEFVIFTETNELLEKLQKKAPFTKIDNSYPIQFLEDIKKLPQVESDYILEGDLMNFNGIYFNATLFNEIIAFIKPKGELIFKITNLTNPLFIYIGGELVALQMPVK